MGSGLARTPNYISANVPHTLGNWLKDWRKSRVMRKKIGTNLRRLSMIWLGLWMKDQKNYTKEFTKIAIFPTVSSILKMLRKNSGY